MGPIPGDSNLIDLGEALAFCLFYSFFPFLRSLGDSDVQPGIKPLFRSSGFTSIMQLASLKRRFSIHPSTKALDIMQIIFC